MTEVLIAQHGDFKLFSGTQSFTYKVLCPRLESTFSMSFLRMAKSPNIGTAHFCDVYHRTFFNGPKPRCVPAPTP